MVSLLLSDRHRENINSAINWKIASSLVIGCEALQEVLSFMPGLGLTLSL